MEAQAFQPLQRVNHLFSKPISGRTQRAGLSMISGSQWAEKEERACRRVVAWDWAHAVSWEKSEPSSEAKQSWNQSLYILRNQDKVLGVQVIQERLNS